MLEKKEKKRIQDIFTKITRIYTNFYILKNGYIISLNIETPYLIQLDIDDISLFKKLFGEFSIIHITDLKYFKKIVTNFFENDSLESTDIFNYKEALNLTDLFDIKEKEEKNVLSKLEEYLTHINSCDKWNDFKLSENEIENDKMIESVFVKNNYIEFQPQNNKHPSLVFTKSLLPLVTEKNYRDVTYATAEIYKNLYIIIFSFEFTLFRIYMLHNYISF